MVIVGFIAQEMCVKDYGEDLEYWQVNHKINMMNKVKNTKYFRNVKHLNTFCQHYCWTSDWRDLDGVLLRREIPVEAGVCRDGDQEIWVRRGDRDCRGLWKGYQNQLCCVFRKLFPNRASLLNINGCCGTPLKSLTSLGLPSKHPCNYKHLRKPRLHLPQGQNMNATPAMTPGTCPCSASAWSWPPRSACVSTRCPAWLSTMRKTNR